MAGLSGRRHSDRDQLHLTAVEVSSATTRIAKADIARRDSGRSASVSVVRVSSVVYAAGLFGVASMLLRAQVDPDAWWHLRVAAGIVQTGQVPTSDAISWWSAATPWISPSWLNELLLYVSNSIAGATGQSLLYLPVYLAIVVMVDRLVALLSPWLPATWRLVTLLLMALALIPVMSPRAGNFDLLFSLFAIYGWVKFRRDGSTLGLWLMPVAAVLWANLHGGGVMVYFALAAAFGVGTWVDRRRFVGWRWRPFLLSVVLTYVALGLNPYGAALYVYPWSTLLSSAQTSTIAEWQSPDFASVSLIGLRALIAVGFVLALARTKMNDAAGALATAGMLFLTLGAIRYLLIAVPLIAIWFLPAMFRGAAGFLPTGWRHRFAPRAVRYAELGIVGVILVLGAAIGAGALPANQERTFAARYPTTTLDVLGRCDFDRVWTDYGWGGWTSYQTGWLVGPYGAADALGDERLTTAGSVERLTTDPGVVFDELRVDAVVTQQGHPLAFWLAANPGWRVVAKDAIAIAAVREGIACTSA
jgi:hypothetical protein